MNFAAQIRRKSLAFNLGISKTGPETRFPVKVGREGGLVVGRFGRTSTRTEYSQGRRRVDDPSQSPERTALRLGRRRQLHGGMYFCDPTRNDPGTSMWDYVVVDGTMPASRQVSPAQLRIVSGLFD